MLLFSVVTVSRNAGSTIRRTLRSVQQQVGVGGLVEHVVIDGNSTDRTTQILREFEDLVWVSESDSGIADAFNKGLKLSRGKYLLYLNADDFLVDDCVLQDAARFLESEHFPPWVVGDVVVGCSTEEGNPSGFPKKKSVPLSCWSLLFRNRIPHPAVFLSRDTLNEVGGFDTSFRYAMDYELWHRLCERKFGPVHMPRVVSVFSLGGVSSTGSPTYFLEQRTVIAKFRDTPFKRLIGNLYDHWVS